MIGVCLHCKDEFHFFPSQSKGKYCGNQCQRSFEIAESIKNGTASTKTLRKWFLKYKKYECSCCGINEWQGEELTLQLDHIDGNRKNNSKKNLRWLCPNCHSQTKTWGNKNTKDRRILSPHFRRKLKLNDFLD